LAINNSGQIAGTIDTPEGLRGFIWDNGVLTTMGYLTLPPPDGPFAPWGIPWPLPEPWSSAHDINDFGQVAGTSWTGEVFGWDNGRMSRLPGLHPYPVVGGEIGEAAINNAGHVVGRYYRDIYPNEDVRCFLWQDGVVTELDRPGVWPSAINDLDVITGTISEFGGSSPFVWKDGVFTKIGDGTGWAAGHGADINNLGQVVGVMDMTAFMWQNGAITALGGLGRPGFSGANAINDAGQVVGDSLAADRDFHAFIWQDGVMADLNSQVPAGSGWLLRSAMDINESGDIVGYGFHNGEFRQFLYTAVDFGIAIDIKPGDSSNTVNLKSNGVLPVAVLASPDYPISSVDASTVSFAGAKPARQTMEDVDGDGDEDLLFHFRTSGLSLDTNSTDANLIGRLSNGCLFTSSDAVRITGR
jgi:probable HAF family extracellular repeat protein